LETDRLNELSWHKLNHGFSSMRNLHRSEDLDSLTHGGLNMDGLEVVPLLLKEGGEEVE